MSVNNAYHAIEQGWDVTYRLEPQERAILRLIEQAGDRAGYLTVDRVVSQDGANARRVHDLAQAGYCELCDHPTDRGPQGQPASSVQLTDEGRVALTRQYGVHRPGRLGRSC